VVTWSWVILTLYGSVYMFLHGVDYAHYINYWKRAIYIMDMDVSRMSRWVGLKHSIVAGILFVVFTGLYASFQIDQITDSAGLVALAVVRAFKNEIQGDTLLEDKKTKKKLYCSQWMSYHGWTTLGFIIQVQRRVTYLKLVYNNDNAN